MREQIKALREELQKSGELDHEIRGELIELGTAIIEKAGAPYTYGLPGSDPNVEQMPDGRLCITLIQPIVSGSEVIDALVMRVPTLGDAKQIKAREAGENATLDEVASGIAKKIELTCISREHGRKLTPSQIEQLTEEDASTIGGAFSFLRSRFRRTGKTFKTS